MKKFTGIFVFGLCAALLLTFGGCADDQVFEQGDYTADPSVTGLVLNVQDREIEIVESDGTQILLTYYESQKEYYDFSVADGVLTVTYVTDKGWTDYIGSKPDAQYRRIRIEIPAGLLTDLDVSTTNEKISLNGVSASGSITLSSNGGDLDLETVAAGENLNLTAKNGSISLQGVSASGTMALNSDGGDLNLDAVDAGEGLNLTAKNGNISGSVLGGWDDFAITCEVKKGDTNLPEQKPGGEKFLNVSCNNGDVDLELVQA